MRILCTADVHIGRRPSRLPAHLDLRLHACGAAWLRIVDHALEQRVDLVVVSGDLVDEANRFFEAIGPFEEGIGRLATAGIETVLVAGNHDHDILPQLVDGLGSPSVRLLGRGGHWERATFERSGQTLHVDGWSFPGPHHRESPLAGYAPEPGRGAVLALLHADLDQAGSVYAPVASTELQRYPGTCWALGHVHAPRSLEAVAGATAFYPGSPQALDPGEPGPHGVVLLEVRPEGFALTHRPLASVRYDTLEVSLEGVERMEEVDRRIYQAVSAHLDAVAPGAGALRHLSCRVRLVGRTALHRRLGTRLPELVSDLDLTRGQVSASVEAIAVETGGAYDLEALARGKGSPATLARLIHQLDSGALEHDGERLLAEAVQARESMTGARPYFALGPPEGDPAGLRIRTATELRRAAALLLDELLAQKEEV